MAADSDLGMQLHLPAGTVTFLLTDIEGSTALWETEPTTMADAVARHYHLIDEAVAAAGGVRPVEQGEGDSTVAAFGRASDAVTAVVGLQRALAAEMWPTTRPLRVRMNRTKTAPPNTWGSAVAFRLSLVALSVPVGAGQIGFWS